MQTLTAFWLIATLVFLILEIGHPNLFFFISFAVGSSVNALIIYLIGDISSASQIAIFFLSSAIAFLLLRKLASRVNARLTKTNMYALEGQIGQVTKQIDPHSFGQVRIVNELWLARTTHERSIGVGSYVRVTRVQGAHVVVDVVENHFHRDHTLKTN